MIVLLTLYLLIQQNFKTHCTQFVLDGQWKRTKGALHYISHTLVSILDVLLAVIPSVYVLKHVVLASSIDFLFYSISQFKRSVDAVSTS